MVHLAYNQQVVCSSLSWYLGNPFNLVDNEGRDQQGDLEDIPDLQEKPTEIHKARKHTAEAQSCGGAVDVITALSNST